MIIQNQLTPVSPLRNFESVRSGAFNKLDTNNKSGLVGPGATIDRSRKLATFFTGQVNAILFEKGGNTNIFV